MTPHQLAKTECANFTPDGTCLWIEPSSWHDYRVPLPDWLTVQQWDGLVAAARASDEVTVNADMRTGGPLDMAMPHANRYRLAMYYCPGCGRRMGVRGEGCQDCRGVPFVPDDVDRRCKVTRGLRCGYFETCILPLADDPPPQSEPGLQRSRTKARQSYLDLHNLPGAKRQRTCPGCGGALAKGKQFCPECRKQRRRTTYRGSRNRSRPNGPRKSLPDKDRKSASGRDGPVGPRTPIPGTSVAPTCRGRHDERRQ